MNPSIAIDASAPATSHDIAIHFISAGVPLVGRLLLPSVRAAGTRPPVVIVAGSWTTVKEQMPSAYVPHLIRAGYAALLFDFRGFGESGGTPREVEAPTMKAHDLRAAAAALARHEAVDGGRIGVLAICASAGYAALASTTDASLRSIAMVAPWLHDCEIVEAVYGGFDAVEQRLAQAHAARARFEASGTVDYIRAASNTDATAAMYWEGDALDYYLNPRRGAIPQWGGRFAVMAWQDWLEFDAIRLAPAVKAATRVITGDATATPVGARRFADAMRAPHDLVSLPGTQFHFYDDPATVEAAARCAIDHFHATL